MAQNYIFEKLIITSSSILDFKCYISGCAYHDELDTSQLANYDIIHDIIKGLNSFPNISEFYNEKYLLSACKAAFLDETSEDYLNCTVDDIILAAINTENLLKLVDDLIFNLIKLDEIVNVYQNETRKYLFAEKDFYKIETIFYRYFLPVERNFAKCIKIDLDNFLSHFFNIISFFWNNYDIILYIF